MLFFKKYAVPSVIWALFLGISLSCQKKDPQGPDTYLIPWPNAAGEYTLQEVTLETLNSPYEMSGTSAKVYSEQGFLDKSLAGRPARPNLSRVNGVFIPQNAESSLVVTVYAHFENLKRMEKEYQLPTQVRWPRTVGTGVPVRLANGGSETNNARYFSDLDVIGITPFSGGGMHIALNAGILAHEHFHAIFESLFMPSVYQELGKDELAVYEGFKDIEKTAGTSLKPTADDNEPTPILQNQLVLRAWNEGLADFFGFVYTHNPDFMGDSIPKRVRQDRRLDGQIGTLQSIEQLRANMTLQAKSGECPSGMCMAYYEGTKISRTLYDIWKKLPAQGQKEFLREIIRGLTVAAKDLSPFLRENPRSLNSIVPYIVSDKRVRQTASCKTMKLLIGNVSGFVETYTSCKDAP